MQKDHTITKEDAQTVLSHINETAIQIERYEEGLINPIYFLTTEDEEYALRLTNLHWDTVKTRNEVNVLQFVHEETEIPVPEIYWYNNDTGEIGYEYILMERVKGRQLSEVYKDLSSKARTQARDSVAEILGELQAHTFDRIGGFTEEIELTAVPDLEAGPYDTFATFKAASIRHCYDGLRENGYGEAIERIERYVQARVEQYNDSVPFCLSHGDLSPENLLWNDGITAVLDWEWALAAPADRDFHCLDSFDDTDEIMRQAEKNGISTPVGFEERADIYELEDICMSLAAWKEWFEDDVEAGQAFAAENEARLESFFDTHEC